MRRTSALALVGALTLTPKEGAAQAGPPVPPAAPAPPAAPTPPPATPEPAPSPPAAPAPPAPAPPPARAPAEPRPAPASPSTAPPGGSASAPAGAPKQADKPQTTPPARPEYYVEEQKPAGGDRKAGPPPSEIYEPPPPPLVEAPAPPPLAPSYIAPKTAFWAGLRVAYFVPFGTLWFDGNYDGQGGLAYRRRQFSAYASPGPAAEVDIGVRVGRRYNLFAMWEHAALGAGNLDPDSFGGQQRGNTNLYGFGFRFSTNPDGVGLLIEVGFGYRTFKAYWENGAELSLDGTFFEGRIGVGVDIRVSKWLSLSPMVAFSQGSFTSAEFTGPAARSAFTAYDQAGQYNTFSLQLGAHADVF